MFSCSAAASLVNMDSIIVKQFFFCKFCYVAFTGMKEYEASVLTRNDHHLQWGAALCFATFAVV